MRSTHPSINVALNIGFIGFVAIAACGAPDSTDHGSEDTAQSASAVRTALPARIQAESYDRAFESTPAENSGGQCNRGDGVDMELTTDAGGGSCNVGWTAAGEWLEYDISVPTTGNYRITLRVASAETGRALHASIDGAALASLPVPSGGWQAWGDAVYASVALSAGNHTIRITFDTDLVNLDYVDFQSVGNACGQAALARAGATASSLETSAFPASLAIDGNATTRWSSQFADPQWISVDLGASRRIRRVVLKWETAFAANYTLDTSDSPNGPWKTIYANSAGKGGTEDIGNLDGAGRYVRMFAKSRSTAWGDSLYEFEVYGDLDPTCVLPKTCVTDSTVNSTSLSIARSDIGARSVIGGIGYGARLALDPVSGQLHYMTASGDIFRVALQSGTGSTSTQVANGTQIMAGTGRVASSFQGLAFAPNGDMYVVSNVKDGLSNRAFIQRGIGANRTWSTFAQTDPYPDSNTPFDHHFNGIVVSPDGNWVYVTSGSRTDHGEIQDVGGQFPNTREIPLTSSMFRMPTSGSGIILKNDLSALKSAGYWFASGLRNSFDPQFGPGGEIFSGDNGPDADYSEELNIVRAGNHYGFPFRLGSEDNAQRSATYDPTHDPRLHAGFSAVDSGSYKNDPTFPAAPASMIDPIVNHGPDADQFRDVTTGQVVDASDTGRRMTTFTAHRSPLGLSFDLNGALCGDFKSNAFILSWGTANPVFPDHGEDLVLLSLTKTTAGQGYEIAAHQIVTGFSRPIDSVLLGSKLYVLEYSESAAGHIYEFSLPH